MPVKVGSDKQKFKYNKTYDIELIIKDNDYSEDILKVSIVNSLSTAYPVFEILLLVDINDIQLEKIYGDDSIKLSITLKAYEGDFGIPGPRYDFELMMIKGEFSLTEKPNLPQEQMQKERSIYRMLCLAKDPFKKMTTVINDVFIGKTIRDILEEIGAKTNTRITYDFDDENTQVIEQVCIPPTTLYNVIKEHDPLSDNLYDGFLDRNFGLFTGPPGVYCDYTGTVKIKNLLSRMRKGQRFTVYHLSDANVDNIQEILNQCTDGYHFYTYDKIITKYSGPAKFGNLSYNISHIIKPSNQLYAVMNFNLEDIAQQHSICYFPNKKIALPHDGNLERHRYYVDHSGHDQSQVPFLSKYSRLMSDLSSVSFRLEKNLDILGLMDVGECVKLVATNLENKDFEGKYILWSSTITFARDFEWSSTALINLIRTNKYI